MEFLWTIVRTNLTCRFGFSYRHCSSDKRKLMDERSREKRRVFWEQEGIREAAVKNHLLTACEKEIYECHAAAVLKGHFTYDDPETKKREYTRLRHYLRGACCGSACRHCIYDHVKVPAGKIKSKRFNSSFWVYNETDADDIDDEYMMSLRRPKQRPNRPQ